eukprot:GHVN01063450.1.p1 GENE.GHVN01063450.1~~GHVN01063450.1.p1  ORF type:complete len:124 (-),score=7.78 GHVN01063450.1:532-903(-)
MYNTFRTEIKAHPSIPRYFAEPNSIPTIFSPKLRNRAPRVGKLMCFSTHVDCLSFHDARARTIEPINAVLVAHAILHPAMMRNKANQLPHRHSTSASDHHQRTVNPAFPKMHPFLKHQLWQPL